MTDQLESDLRTMLATRALDVTAEIDAGEIAVAERLRAGDDGLTGALAAHTARNPRRPWLVTALAAAAAVIVGVLVLRDDDPTVRSGPAATPTTTEAPPADDPTVGTELDSAKDVAERVALAVFGEEYITMAANDAGDTTFVTMEGPGGSVVAEVVFDEGIGRQRLVSITSSTLDPPASLGSIEDGQLVLDLPVGGTLTVTGLDAQLQVTGSTLAIPATSQELHVTDVDPWLSGATWVWISVVTDGEVLQSFGRL